MKSPYFTLNSVTCRVKRQVCWLIQWNYVSLSLTHWKSRNTFTISPAWEPFRTLQRLETLTAGATRRVPTLEHWEWVDNFISSAFSASLWFNNRRIRPMSLSAALKMRFVPLVRTRWEIRAPRFDWRCEFVIAADSRAVSYTHLTLPTKRIV